MDYLCIPNTIVYLSDVFPTLSNLFQSLFIFALINVPMFWLFLIVDRFHWLQHYYTFGLQSLWTISHIQTLQHHFNPSDITTTYTSPTTPIKKEKNFTLHSQDLVRLCITSIWLRLCSPALLDLVPHTLTLTHCILPCSTALFWLFLVLACVLSVSHWSHSIFCYLHVRTPSLFNIPLSDLYWAGYHPFTPFSHRSFATGTDLPGLSQLLDHF
jgi:hypothetical protein